MDGWIVVAFEWTRGGGNGGRFCLISIISLQRYSVGGPCQKDIPSNRDRSINGKACSIRLLPLRVRTTRRAPNPWRYNLIKHNQPITIPPPPPLSLFFFFRRKCGKWPLVMAPPLYWSALCFVACFNFDRWGGQLFVIIMTRIFKCCVCMIHIGSHGGAMCRERTAQMGDKNHIAGIETAEEREVPYYGGYGSDFWTTTCPWCWAHDPKSPKIDLENLWAWPWTLNSTLIIIPPLLLPPPPPPSVL